ncbi:MAG: Holliday junction resolvase RuvX [Mycobacteriales bacterium]
MTGPDLGVLLAVDVGTVRVGVAASDPDRVLASPLVTLRRGAGTAAEVAALAAERAAVAVVVGLPKSLSGAEGAAVAMAREFAAELALLVAPVPVRLVDERLTTVAATRALAASGVRGPAARAVVDQAAAVALLQGVLDGGR